MVQNVALGTLSDEIHVDAVVDTGATVCILPRAFARQLGFNPGNRLGGGPIRVIGGGTVQIDEHRLESVRVGSATAYGVEIGVCTTFAGSRYMLLGINFLKKFATTTVDFERRVVRMRTGGG